jgi:hypothetical protein
MCLGDISVRSLTAHSTGVAPIERDDFICVFLDCLDGRASAGRRGISPAKIYIFVLCVTY